MRTLAITLIVLLGAAERALASQVVIQEVTYTHGPDTTHDSHYTIDALPASPANWTAPVDYTAGTVWVRLEVFDKPSDAKTRFQICFEGSPYSCTNQSPVYTTTGVYSWPSTFDQFYSPGTPTYTTSPKKMSLILKDDKNGKPAPENVGDELSALYMPTDIRVTITMVTAGSTYEPPPATEEEPVVEEPPVGEDDSGPVVTDDVVSDSDSVQDDDVDIAADETRDGVSSVTGGCQAAPLSLYGLVLGALLARFRRRR